MKKKLVFISFFTCLLSSLFVSAQTTELVYHLGVSGNPLSVTSVVTDADGNIFICGTYKGAAVEFNPLDIPANSVTKTSVTLSQDGFVAKYNSSGILLKAHSFGTSNPADKAVKLALDNSGNVYLAAVIFGSTLFDLSTGFSSNAIGGSGATVLVKYDNDLTFQSLRTIRAGSGAAGDEITDVKTDGSGNVYVTGSVTSSDLDFEWVNAAPVSAYAISSNGLSDIFVAKYNSSLDCQWAYNIGDTGADMGNSMDLDNAGNIYITGIFTGQDVDFSPASATANTISETGGGVSPSGDVFVAKYSSSMAYQWAFGFGSGLLDEGVSIAVNKSTSTVFVAGNVKNDALNVDFDPSAATANFSGVGLNDLFIASYTGAGAYRWHKGIGSASDDYVTGITLGGANTVLMTGAFQGTNVDFGNGQVISAAGGKDVFVAEFSTSGTTSNAFSAGGTGNEEGSALYFNSGKLLVSGTLTAAGDYDPTGAISTLTPNGSQDGFVVRYALCTAPAITTHPLTQAVCNAASVTLSVIAGSAVSYQWKKGGVAISGETSASYTINPVDASDAGLYTVDVINTCNTVTSNAAVITVSTCTPVTLANESDIVVNIYPKPAVSTSVIEFKNRKGKLAVVTILSGSGSIVWTGSYHLSSDLDEYTLPINEFSPGLYIVQIQIEGELFTDKLQRNP